MKIIHATALLAAATLCGTGLQAQELRVGFTLDALTLDPANHRKRETQTILRNMYDGVLTRDADMNIVPELAAGWRQVDGVTYEFTLRQGVTFHDGTPMTAEDVKFTFDRLTTEGAMDGQTSPRQSLLGPLERVEIVDPSTVRFVLSEPWAILPAMLPFQEVVSKAFVERVGSAGMATEVNGTGPFRLLEWRKGDSIIMERFDDYYGGAADIPPVGPACVERVIFRIIPESASRVAALLSGDVHIVNELPAHNMKQVEANPDTEVMTVNGTRTFFVALNNTRPPFDDPRVRRAANHAIDKGLIIDRILNGTATPLNGVMSPDAFSFNADLPAYGFDPEQARALLAEAGHPDGVEVTLDVEGAFKDQAEAVAAVMAQGSFNVRVQVGEGSMLRQKWIDASDREGDMYFTSWGNGSLDPVDIMEPTLKTGGRGNSAGYSNPQLDALLEQGSTELDTARREAIYREAQAIVNADAPWIFLWLPQDIYGVSKRLSGWRPSADSRINLHDACLN
jgi:peptide/nickel transport system substrate-binding protein